MCSACKCHPGSSVARTAQPASGRPTAALLLRRTFWLLTATLQRARCMPWPVSGLPTAALQAWRTRGSECQLQ